MTFGDVTAVTCHFGGVTDAIPASMVECYGRAHPGDGVVGA